MKADMLEDWDKRKQLAEIRRQLTDKYGKCVDDIKLPTQMNETLRELKAVRKMQRQGNKILAKSGVPQTAGTDISLTTAACSSAVKPD